MIETSGQNGESIGFAQQAGGKAGEVVLVTSLPDPLEIPSIVTRGQDSDLTDTRDPA